jgi:hypothetical protein
MPGGGGGAADAAGGALKTARLLADLASAARRGARHDAGALAEHVLAELREASGELVAARFQTDLMRRIQRLVERHACARVRVRARCVLAGGPWHAPYLQTRPAGAGAWRATHAPRTPAVLRCRAAAR